MDLNSVLIEGKLLGSTSFEETPDGRHVCKFELQAGVSGGKRSAIVPVRVYGRDAVLCRASLTPVSHVRIVGFISEETYVGADGLVCDYATLVVVAESVELS